MEFRTPTINRATNLYRAVARTHKKLLQGRVLVLDPSCGSMSSLPGYAVYEAGVLVDSGVVEMPIEARLHRRLYYLGRVLREQFPEKFDVVVYEEIPSLRYSKAGRSLKSQVSLHYAVGVILSSFNCEWYVSVTPQTWRSFASEEHLQAKGMGESSDESDAIVMGHAVMEVARHIEAAVSTGGRGRGRGSKKRGRA